jgi:prepilin peptidase CpaA
MRMLGETKDLVYAISAACSAVAGAAHDLKSRRIPNLLTGGSLLCGLGLHFALGGLPGLGASALAGLVAGGAFLLFYTAGGLGAGDVKLMAAVGCLAGLMPLESLLAVTAVTGALLALGIAMQQGKLQQTLVHTWTLVGHHQRQGLVPHPELNVSNAQTLRMPFAVPIAAGCLASLGMQIWKG